MLFHIFAGALPSALHYLNGAAIHPHEHETVARASHTADLPRGESLRFTAARVHTVAYPTLSKGSHRDQSTRCTHFAELRLGN